MGVDDDLATVTRKYGFEFQMKTEQREAIASIIDGKDTFVCLPTGFGKSKCYIMPPLIQSL